MQQRRPAPAGLLRVLHGFADGLGTRPPTVTTMHSRRQTGLGGLIRRCQVGVQSRRPASDLDVCEVASAAKQYAGGGFERAGAQRMPNMSITLRFGSGKGSKVSGGD